MNLSETLPGTWLLQSRIDVTAAGERHPDPLLGEDPVALLIYDRTGHFAAQFMKRDRSKVVAAGPANPKNNTQAQGGYDAYFGTYSVDDSTNLVTQKLMGALSAGNIGLVLSRAMEVRGDTLRIRLETTAADGTPVVRTLTWLRQKENAAAPPDACLDGPPPSVDHAAGPNPGDRAAAPEHQQRRPMIRVSVLYPHTDGARFDWSYYLGSHMPMVARKFGAAAKTTSVEQGISGGAPDAPAPYVAIASFVFASVPAFQAAFAPHAQEIMADISKYTTIQPVIQISELRNGA